MEKELTNDELRQIYMSKKHKVKKYCECKGWTDVYPYKNGYRCDKCNRDLKRLIKL